MTASSPIEEQKVAVADSEVHFEADIESSVDEMARNEILPENEAGSAETKTTVACTTGKIEDIDGNLTACPVSTAVDVQPPWEASIAVGRPQELLARHERVSDWLNPKQHSTKESATHQTADFSSDERLSKPVDSAASRQSVDHRSLFEQWPPQLEERRHIWFLPPPSSKSVDSTNSAKARLQPVVYWMSNTLRVTQGNYALEAAILLSRRLNAPLVVVCLVPSSLIYPACHATTASEAYARYSFVEMYDQFAQVKVPFYGITAKEDGSLVPRAEKQSFILEPNPLFQLLDAFTPQAVVTDAAFDAPSRSDMQRLTRYLNLNRSSCSWSLLSMDSTTCCPAYRRSPKLQTTLERGIQFASEGQFGVEYVAVAQPSNETYEFSPLSGTATQAAIHTQLLSKVLQQLHLEEVDWRVVKAANSQSSPQMQRFSEAEGLQKLSQLLAESRGQPAIQAELQGGGILSLLPFIRHGSLFAGYVLRRISEAIVSCPAPNTPQERKALAMRKVHELIIDLLVSAIWLVASRRIDLCFVW
ncbi:hypothetical protein BBJ28_00017833 [Nothophytophthora sp. Chile5]|nr:hypothetical protein BBJ28_00017833 [Nothophytophthora sp. Chile5]